jgi:hypothetical protein
MQQHPVPAWWREKMRTTQHIREYLCAECKSPWLPLEAVPPKLSLHVVVENSTKAGQLPGIHQAEGLLQQLTGSLIS